VPSDQQRESLSHFSRRAAEWRDFADGRTERFNVSAARHRAVLAGCAELGEAKCFLDVGCGSGQLVIEMSRRGHVSRGIDFSPEMIALCVAAAKDAQVNAQFACESVFDTRWLEPSPDVVSAQGLIEYLSPDELSAFLQMLRDKLAADTRLFVGTRNRLFNLFSLNSYTELELSLGTERRLFDEAIVLASEAPWEEIKARLLEMPLIEQKAAAHPRTGAIEVHTRHQYTPAELAVMLREVGFDLERIFPIHYHAFAPGSLTGGIRSLHLQIAAQVDERGGPDHRLVPQSSSAVLQFVKVRGHG
jgi:2-polyprenyl-3-methyl-5-hydroxy-6-metoxy-1,4-benzoquinol methylase